MARRILLVMIEPPAPFGSAAARWYYVLLKGLVERGHSVTAFATCSREQEAADVSRWFPSSRYDLRVFPSARTHGLSGKWKTLREPHSYVFGSDIRRAIDAELRRPFDILHCEQLWSGWLAQEVADRTLVHVHYLYDIDLGASRAVDLRRALQLHGERRLLRRFPTMTAVTPRVARRISELSPQSAVGCIPLALDLSLYAFRDTSADLTRQPPTVGLIGSLGWGPGYSAGTRMVSRLWPAIRQQVPEARLTIVGRDARQALRHLPLSEGVTIHENVPDALPYFRDLRVMLYAPERGSGAKVKVLEAFALGTPVVTNDDGIEGLAAVDHIHAGVANDDDGLVARTVALLRDPDRADVQRRNARALVEQHCDLPVILDKVEQAHDVVLGRAAGKPIPRGAPRVPLALQG